MPHMVSEDVPSARLQDQDEHHELRRLRGMQEQGGAPGYGIFYGVFYGISHGIGSLKMMSIWRLREGTGSGVT